MNLILSPHIDDEILGCYTQLNRNCFVLYFGVENRDYAPKSVRIQELESSANELGFSWEVMDFKVNSYDENALVAPIEMFINRLKPKRILVPHFSYNQDHRAVHNAAFTALRPHDRNYFVREVLVYEQPHTLIWPVKEFHPDFFVPMDIEEKLRIYNLYTTQVRGHRSAELLKAMAVSRGNMAGCKYAEAFHCLRYVESK